MALTDLYTEAVASLQRPTSGTLEYARTVILPDGDFAGTAYDPDVHPAQRCALDAMDAGASWVAILKPVQDGGSLASFVPILRRAHLLGQTSIIAYPTMDAGKDAWSKKVWPILESQGGVLPKQGGGSRGGAARVVKLPGGGSIILRAAGGRQESGQASVTADAMLVDEVDDWADMRVLRLIERRLSRSRDPLIIYVSTCKRDSTEGVEQSRIVRLYESGTQTRLTYPCPHCAAMFTPAWEHVDIENRAILCPHCGGSIDEAQRLEMLKHWHRIDGQKTHRFSIMWTALESPFPMLIDGQRRPVIEGLCLEYEAATCMAATSDHGPLRQFYRDRLCRPYRGDMSDEDMPIQLSRLGLVARATAGPYEIEDSTREQDGDSRHICSPMAGEFATCGVDVQQGGERAPGRLYWVVRVERSDGTRWPAGWGTMALCPIGQQPTARDIEDGLGRLQGLLKETDWGAPVVAVGVDVGDRAERIIPSLTARRWWPVKGHEGLKLAPGDTPNTVAPRPQADGHVLYFVETATVRQRIHAALSLQPDKPGAMLLPRGLSTQDALVRHLVGTVQVVDGKRGLRWTEKATDRKLHPEWQRRIDYLDCCCYADAIAAHWRTIQRRGMARRKYGLVGRLG